jgi:hypothetical protein
MSLSEHAASQSKLAREHAQAKARVRDLEQRVAELEQEQAGLRFLTTADSTAPAWLAVKAPTGLYHATPALDLSDLHLDEVVRPEEVEGLNAYNREIAVLRLRRCLEHTVLMARKYLAGVTYDGFLLQLLGDTFSGTIHDELVQTNEDTLFGSMLFWSKELVGFVGGLVEEFGKVHVVAVPGNHGRQTRKPRAKLRARDNCDWFVAHLIAQAFRNDDRVTFNIPESADVDVRIYNTLIHDTHGDQARGGSGISGKHAPLALMEHRKARRALQVESLKRRERKGRPIKTEGLFGVLHHGHFHEYSPGRIACNGSLKGIDEFSYTSNFGFEEPIQAFYLVTPEHGVSLHAPIYCAASRREEKW